MLIERSCLPQPTDDPFNHKKHTVGPSSHGEITSAAQPARWESGILSHREGIMPALTQGISDKPDSDKLHLRSAA